VFLIELSQSGCREIAQEDITERSFVAAAMVELLIAVTVWSNLI